MVIERILYTRVHHVFDIVVIIIIVIVSPFVHPAEVSSIHRQ